MYFLVRYITINAMRLPKKTDKKSRQKSILYRAYNINKISAICVLQSRFFNRYFKGYKANKTLVSECVWLNDKHIHRVALFINRHNILVRQTDFFFNFEPPWCWTFMAVAWCNRQLTVLFEKRLASCNSFDRSVTIDNTPGEWNVHTFPLYRNSRQKYSNICRYILCNFFGGGGWWGMATEKIEKMKAQGKKIR